VGCCFINVNLKGREPTGIVDPADYDQTVAEIITALQTYGRTEDGSAIALSFAVEKEQAGFVGQGGEDCGDVVYGLAGCKLGGFIGGVHAMQIPSARTETGDIRSLCMIAGPRFKEGGSLSRPMDLTDIAPTLCYALNYPQPKDATGGIIFQAFREES
jgi:predicted AlkP superfamily phosphohydrolase/phosphomutase